MSRPRSRACGHLSPSPGQTNPQLGSGRRPRAACLSRLVGGPCYGTSRCLKVSSRMKVTACARLLEAAQRTGAARTAAASAGGAPVSRGGARSALRMDKRKRRAPRQNARLPASPPATQQRRDPGAGAVPHQRAGRQPKVAAASGGALTSRRFKPSPDGARRRAPGARPHGAATGWGSDKCHWRGFGPPAGRGRGLWQGARWPGR